MKVTHISIDKFKAMLSKKRIILTVCAVLIFCMITGGSIAWLVSISEPVNNEFDPAKVTIDVTESPFDHETKRQVRIENTSTIHTYIRVALVPEWIDENGNVVAQEASLDDCLITWGEGVLHNEDLIIAWSEGTLGPDIEEPTWFKGSDGYYYCIAPVPPKSDEPNAPENYTPILIEECKVKPLGTSIPLPHEYDFELRIIASAVQAIPTSAVTEAWPVEVDDSGILIIPSSPTPSVPPTPFASPEENQGGN